MRRMGIVALFTASLALLSSGAALAADKFGGKDELTTLSGVYASSAPEPWYGGYGTRRFTFENGTWGLTFVHALDPQMTQKTFSFRTAGPYRIEAPSAVVPGAFEAVFVEKVKYLTLLTSDANIIQAFGLAACGLTLNAEKDISVSGCAAWRPVSVCSEDHDLLAISAEGLQFGVRPADNDMCTPDKRPTALLQPVVKQ